MYHLHEVPETNLLNPAVPMPCGVVIGLPVISSVHFNAGNNVVSLNQVLISYGDGDYVSDYYKLGQHLHRRNFINGESHILLLAIGTRIKEWSVFFAIEEKSNFFLSGSKKQVQLALYGNSQFEGGDVKLNGLGLDLTHYREYGISISKNISETERFGIRAKLLFGKLNATIKRSDIKMNIDDPTYDIDINGTIDLRTSMPVYGNFQDNEYIDSGTDDYTIRELVFNTGNPGIAFDLGYVYQWDEQTVFSASVLDIGFIRWRKYIHNYIGEGDLSYGGLEVDPSNEYIMSNFGNAFVDNTSIQTNSNPYTTFLPTKLITGVRRQLSDLVGVSITGDAQFYRTKLITGLTIAGDIAPINNVKMISSISYQYNTLKNIGLGFVLGKNPLQFYVITDNIASYIWLFGSRNVNLRFGLNIIPGCKKTNFDRIRSNQSEIKSLDGVCGWENQSKRSRRH